MWDVALYETFGRERVRPSADLAERLAGRPFGRIFDAGCGSGMSTAVLARMWPDARTTLDLRAVPFGRRFSVPGRYYRERRGKKS